MITSFRMYNAGPRAAKAWHALFGKVFEQLRLDVRMIEHRWPDPIADLWQKPDLFCDFMCGWPFVRSDRAMQAIAAPVPSPLAYAGLPRYRSEFLVRDASGWDKLEDTFGHRFGWMARDSQSGFSAPRAHLAGFVDAVRPALFAKVCGPLGTPMTTLAALRSDEIDVIALDSFFLDLLRRHAPEKLADLRSIGTTRWTPIPLLVAAPAIDTGIVSQIRCRLLAIHQDPAYAELLEEVLVARFVMPEVATYQELEAAARDAVEQGYESIR